MKTNTLTQLSLELQSLVGYLHALPQRLQPVNRTVFKPVKLPKAWLLSGVGLSLLWLWFWQWMLSVAVGLAVMTGVYWVQQQRRPWQGAWQKWQKWNRANQPLSLSVLAGILALGSTYLATAVWLESEQHWLATSIILEGLGMFAVFGLLLWQLLQRQPQQDQSGTHQWLQDLSDADPLRRLIAVRQLTQLSHTSPTQVAMSPVQLAECLRLMLDRETEPMVCSALIESLRELHPVRQLEGSQLSAVNMRRQEVRQASEL